MYNMGEKTKLLLLLILLIGTILRLQNIESIPRWDYDEGVNMNIARNLVNGKLLLFNLTYPFIPHPPLFFIILGFLLKFFGNGLIVLRALTAIYGILAIVLVYLISKELFNERLGLLAGFLLAIYPNAIYFNRIGFANSQLMLLSILTIYFFLRYMRDNRDKWFYLLSITTGFAMITEFVGIAIFLSVLLLFWIYYRKNFIKVFLISIIPFALFVSSMLILMPNAFVHDLFFQFERLGEFEKANIGILNTVFLALFLFLIYYSRNWIKNLYRNIAGDMISLLNPNISQEKRDRIIQNNIMLFLFFITLLLAVTLLAPINDEKIFEGFPDYFMLGIFGLFMVDSKKVRNFLLLFFLPIFLFIIKINRTDHMIIPLYPYFSIGLAILLYKIHGFVKSSRFRIIAILLLLSPFAFLLYNDVSSFVLGKGISVENIEERIMVAEFINSNSDITDMVIADSHLVRFINAKASDFVHSVAIEKKKIVYMDPNLGDGRFIFNSSYRNAKFFVVNKGDIEELDEIGEKYGSMKEILTEIEKWPVLRIGNYSIYQNPYYRM